jgi:ribosomal protein L31E
MRSKVERQARHTTNLRTLRRSTTKSRNRDMVTKSKGKVYKHTKIDGQSFYTEIKTKKD